MGPVYSAVEFADRISAARSNAQLLKIFSTCCRQKGIKYSIYVSPVIAGFSLSNPFVLLSFPPQWVAHYRKNGYFDIDPAINMSLATALPVNWAKIPKRGKRVKQLFEDAEKFKLGRSGLTVPIFEKSGFGGLFSVTSDMVDREWNERCMEIEQFVVSISHHVHLRAIELNGSHSFRETVENLTVMELSCLRWTAEGKTMVEVGDMLGIRERTVRMHLSNARGKLQAGNTTHAVAKLIRCGIL